MAEQFVNHVAKFIDISDVDVAQLLTYFQVKSFNKKQNLLEEGELCKANYFVLKGCLRLFFVNEKGVEQTTQFALENWWMTDLMAFQNQKPANFTIQAVEKSEVLVMQHQSMEQLTAQFPVMERYFRIIYQKAYAASQLRIKYLYDFSREELYHHFARQYPAFIQRIPQYLLASFLGFTPEYLSEIRRQKRS